MKSRGVYETPGGAILHFAHRQMETLTMDREVMHLRDALTQSVCFHPHNPHPVFDHPLPLPRARDIALRGAGVLRLLVFAGASGVANARRGVAEKRPRHGACETLQGQPHGRGPQIPGEAHYNPHLATMEADATKAYNQDDATTMTRLRRCAAGRRLAL